MDWDAIGAMGEVVAAIAVVVSIGYLAIQIRSNTSAMKASASFDATHSWAEHNSAVLGPLSDELWLSAVRANDPGEPAENFTDLEKLKFAVLNRALFQNWKASISSTNTDISNLACGRHDVGGRSRI